MEQVAFIKDAQAELIRIRQDGINQASFFGGMPKIAFLNLREAGVDLEAAG